MKNEALTKPFPYNLFDDLGIEAPQTEAEDFLPTLMYILRCIATPRDSKAIMMRYKEGKTYEEIGDAFGISKQRANYMLQDILEKFTNEYCSILTKGIKTYYENLLIERINALEPTIAESEREDIEMSAYEEGYTKGYNDGLTGRKASATNKNALNNIDISTLQLSTRTFNALRRNKAETLGDVVSFGDDIIAFEGFGKTCFLEIAKVLASYGVNIEVSFPDCVKKWGNN